MNKTTKSLAPLLSVVVPTRNRPELAKICVGRLLQDLPEAVEIVVLENSDVPSLSADDFGNHPIVQVYPSDRPLDMPSNWERGLSIARGQYLTYLSDKDMFLPGGLRSLVDHLATRQHEILCFRKAWFCDLDQKRLLGHYRCRGGVHIVNLKPILEHLSRHFIHLHTAPMIYNAAVSRDLIREIQGTNPRFFISTSPDVITTILFAAHRDTYAQLDEMLCVQHAGEWSTGYSAIRLGRKSKQIEDLLGLMPSNPLDSMKLPLCHSSGMLEVLLTAKSAYPDRLGGLRVDWQRFLQDVHASVGNMEISPDEKAAELRILRSWNCVVPRWEYFKYRLLQGFFRVKKKFHKLVQGFFRVKKKLFPGGLGIAKRLSKAKGKANDKAAPGELPGLPMWHLDHIMNFAYPKSIDESLAIAAKNNLHHESIAQKLVSEMR